MFSDAREFISSCNLKGNCTFTAWAEPTRNDEAEEDQCVKPEGEGVPSADEDVEASGRVGETDQCVEYVIHFAKAVELYQKKNKNCFGCGSPDHLIWDCPKDVSRSAWKAYLNMKKGTAKKGGWGPQKAAAGKWTSLDKKPWA